MAVIMAKDRMAIFRSVFTLICFLATFNVESLFTGMVMLSIALTYLYITIDEYLS